MGIWPTNMPKHKTVKVSWHKGCKQFSLNRSQILHVSISWVFRVVGFDELLVKCIWVHLGAPRVIRGFAERCSPKFTGWSWIHQKISKAQKRSNNLTPHCKKVLIYPSLFFPIAIIPFPVDIDTPFYDPKQVMNHPIQPRWLRGLVYFWTGEGMIFPSDVNTLKSQPLLGSFIWKKLYM